MKLEEYVKILLNLKDRCYYHECTDGESVLAVDFKDVIKALIEDLD